MRKAGMYSVVFWLYLALVAAGCKGTTTNGTTVPGTTNKTDKLTASDAQAYEFGYDVATSSDGNTIVVGARSVSAAYIYKWDGVSWSETKMTVSDGLLFGNSVSISSDGNTIVVGAYESTVGNNIHQGAAYVFEWDGSSWQSSKLTASDGMAEDLFGIDVAVSGDGASILVGAWFAHEGSINGPKSQGPGLAYNYRWNGSTWLETKLSASDAVAGDSFGFSVALSADGNTAVVGARDAKIGTNSLQGAVYVYNWNGAAWRETKLIASDGGMNHRFGYSVSVSSDGHTIISGAPNGDSAYIYTNSGASWGELKLVPSVFSENFGVSVAISSDASSVIVGADYAASGPQTTPGAAFVYRWGGASWQEEMLIAPDGKSGDRFGAAVAVSSDGSTMVVGATADGGTGPGYVDVFR